MVDILDHTMCLGVEEESPYDPIGRTNTFVAEQEEIYQWTKFGTLYSGGTVQWKWYKDGSLYYDDSFAEIPDPSSEGWEWWNWYVKSNGWNFLYAGEYYVEVYFNGVLAVIDYFTVGELPCECTNWINGECISDTQRRQIRTCDPPGCNDEERIVDDSSCYIPPLCECTNWVNVECISDSQRRQTRACDPPGCNDEERIIDDSSCYIPPLCECTNWVNGECISDSQRRQTRACDPPGCNDEERIVDDSSCYIPPIPPPTKITSLLLFGGATIGALFLLNTKTKNKKI